MSTDPKQGHKSGVTDETVQFLPDQQASKDANQTEMQGNEAERKKCCRCCNLKCSLLTAAIIVLLIFIVIAAGYFRYRSQLTGKATSETSAMWEEILLATKSSNQGGQGNSYKDFSGMFELVSFDENYDNYLLAMGTPSIFLGLIKSSAVHLFISAPRDDSQGVWKWRKLTDTSDTDHTFSLGTEFVTQWGRGKGDLHTVCRIEAAQPNVLSCLEQEREKNWNITHKYTFSNEGLADIIHFVSESKEAKTNKYYKRLSTEEIEALKQEIEELDAQSPFSDDSEDDDFFDDDWDS